MSNPVRFGRSVIAYLDQQGWVRESEGPVGSLWRSSSPGEVDVIAVPMGEIKRGDRAWRSVVERIAIHERRDPLEVASNIENQYTDVTHLRAANDLVISGSIPLDAGATLVASAKEMLRSSATTAQRARSQIDGNFSKIGDALVKQARLGHTIDRSYAIPVLMPLPFEPTSADSDLEITGIEGHRAAPESPERRVMRTFAQALNAVNRVIVEPARQPRQSDVPSLVVAGVSREFVSALSRIVGQPAVAEFEATFIWAAAVRTTSDVPVTVSIPPASVELLDQAARLLKATRRDPPQSVTGPIVEVRHVPPDRFGEVAVQTTRNGRPAEIRVRLGLEDIDRSHEWMRTGTTVIVDGVIVRNPGHPLRIDAPTRYGSLSSAFLDGAQD